MIPILAHMTKKRMARFYRRIARRAPDACWPWLGYCLPNGYGTFSIEPHGSGKTLNLLAHRVAKTLALGRDLVDLGRHSCDNPPCCNPAHILEGTHQDNHDDMVARGRQAAIQHLRGVYGTTHPAARYTEADRTHAITLFQAGVLRGEIARIIGCHHTTISCWLYDAFPQSFAMPAALRRMRRS